MQIVGYINIKITCMAKNEKQLVLWLDIWGIVVWSTAGAVELFHFKTSTLGCGPHLALYSGGTSTAVAGYKAVGPCSWPRTPISCQGLKVTCGAFSALQPVGRLYPCPQWVPLIHLQRRHAPHRHEKPLLAKEGTIQGILLAHHNSCKAGTWGRFFQRKACGGFFRCLKNLTTSARFEPANSGTRGQHANRYATDAVWCQGLEWVAF